LARQRYMVEEIIKLVANLSLDNAILKEAAQGNF
jgi:hypothetical protein